MINHDNIMGFRENQKNRFRLDSNRTFSTFKAGLTMWSTWSSRSSFSISSTQWAGKQREGTVIWCLVAMGHKVQVGSTDMTVEESCELAGTIHRERWTTAEPGVLGASNRNYCILCGSSHHCNFRRFPRPKNPNLLRHQVAGTPTNWNTTSSDDWLGSPRWQFPSICPTANLYRLRISPAPHREPAIAIQQTYLISCCILSCHPLAFAIVLFPMAIAVQFPKPLRAQWPWMPRRCQYQGK